MTVPGAIRIGDRAVGPGQPCYVIAEAGSNHNGDTDLAFALIDAAADARCDAVKFQVFKADRLVAKGSPRASYLDSLMAEDEGLYELFSRTAIDRDVLPALADRCRLRGIDFLATPFDSDAVAALVAPPVDAPALKNASSELWDISLIESEARTGRPLILSTGMADLDDVREAVDAARAAGATEIVLLHCTVAYPTLPSDLNLRAMHTLQEEFQIPSGLSDHTLGIWAPVAAVALGAALVEKHFTLSRGLEGPDHAFALEPAELAQMVTDIRNVEAGLGDGRKARRAAEEEIHALGRRNIVARRDLEAGHVLVGDDLDVLRSELGIAPARLPAVVGRRLERSVRAGSPLQWDDLA